MGDVPSGSLVHEAGLHTERSLVVDVAIVGRQDLQGVQGVRGGQGKEVRREGRNHLIAPVGLQTEPEASSSRRIARRRPHHKWCYSWSGKGGESTTEDIFSQMGRITLQSALPCLFPSLICAKIK